MVWFTWIEDGDWGMYYSWEQLDRSTGLVLCPSETVGWPSVAACISWWSLWHGWDWTLDSLVKGPWINLSALIGQQDRTWDLYSSLFGELDQARVCTKFPGQMRPQVLLCRWGKPWALFSVWMPLYVGPLNGLCWLPPCSGEVLIEQAETCIQLWVGLGFSFSALGTVGEAALKPVKTSVCCLISNSSFSPSGERGPEDTPPQLGLWLGSLPGGRQPGLKSQQNASFEDPDQADLHPLESSGQSAPPICFCRWAELLAGKTIWELQV